MAEIARLEGLFSLWRADTRLSELNRRGVLVAPAARHGAPAGRGAARRGADRRPFDVTVQPLWALYRDHFAAAATRPDGPPGPRSRRPLALVDQRRLLVSPDRIALLARGAWR